MINCKKDLINTYVRNTPELRREFLSFAVKFGLIDSKSKIGESSEDAVVACWNAVTGDNPKVGCWFAFADQIKEECRELTLSDLKPRTKTEFVKVEYSHAWEIIKLYEDGVEIFKDDSDELQIDRINSIALRAQAGYPIYRKVETEIDERQEFIDAVSKILPEYDKRTMPLWIGKLYDSGKFKLVEK